MTTQLGKILALTLFALLVAGTGPSNAALKGVSSSVSPIGGFPVWIQDQNSLSLQACLEPLNCVLPVAGEEDQYNPAQPLSFPSPLNFPAEHFYFFAESSVSITPNNSGSLVRMVIEAAFLPSIAPGNQSFFHRFRVRLQNPPETGAYTLLHPWGSTTFTGQECTAGVICTMTADVNVGEPPAFLGILDSAPEGSISTFLSQTSPVPADGYIGNPAVAGPVTGGTVRNIVQIVAPSTAVIGSSDQFLVAGKKIGMDVNPSPAAPVATTLVGTPVVIPVTVTNITGAPVAFTNLAALAVTGSNAADFAIVPETDTCSGQTLPIPDPQAIPPVTGACSFQVRFNPTATVVATRNAVVTITPDVTETAPPVSVALTGIAQYQITPTVATSVTPTGTRAAGTISPAVVQNVNAGGAFEFTLVPESGYFPRVQVDGSHVAPTGSNKYAFSGLNNHYALNVKYVRNGDLVEDGVIDAADALRALQVALGSGTAATDDEMVAADIGPLAASKPKADGSVDVSDVLVILRRAVGLDPAW